jgi:hypothetical protein
VVVLHQKALVFRVLCLCFRKNQDINLCKLNTVYTKSRRGGGDDIDPLGAQGTVLIGFKPDSQRYFEYHHASNDKFEHRNKREIRAWCSFYDTTLVYLLDKYGL